MSASEQLLRLAWLVGLSGCSLGKLETSPCTNNAECRDSFGLNAVCAEEGLCRVEPPAARCDRTHPEDLYSRPDRYPDVVVIGNLMDRSEPKKQVRENAARLAAMQVDQAGGLPGRQLAMVYCTIEPNYQGDGVPLSEAAVTTARYLVDVVGVPAIVGPSSSGATLAVFEALEGTGTLVISPSATSPALSEAEPNEPSDDEPGLLWRTAPSDSIQGELIAADMEERGVPSVVAIVQKGAYGEGLYQEFADNLPSSITSDVELFSVSGERTVALTRAAGSGAEEVLFISSLGEDIRAFLTAASSTSSNGLETKKLFLTDAAASSDELSGFEAVFDRLRGTRPKPLGEDDFAYGNFLIGYETAFQQDARQFSFAAHAYDATWLVFYGLAWAHLNESAGVTGKGIARGMRRVSSGPDTEVIPTTWTSVLDQFAKGDGVDLLGASGELDFDPVTEETMGPLEVWIAVEGADGAVTIEPAPGL